MTKQEKQLASALLEMAADTFSNHGCNDFELPNTQESVDLLNAMERWNVGEGEEPEQVHVLNPADKTIYTQDWYLMKYLSSKLNEEQSKEPA